MRDIGCCCAPVQDISPRQCLTDVLVCSSLNLAGAAQTLPWNHLEDAKLGEAIFQCWAL